MFHLRNFLASVSQNIWVELFTSPFTFVRQPWFKDESRTTRIAGYVACVFTVFIPFAVIALLFLLTWVLAA